MSVSGLVWSTVYQVPVGGQAVVSTCSVSNNGSSADTFAIRVTPSGGTARYLVPLGTGNLAAKTRVAFTEGWALSDGDKIEATAANGCDVVMFGTEIS